jgi:hypothetical protein
MRCVYLKTRPCPDDSQGNVSDGITDRDLRFLLLELPDRGDKANISRLPRPIVVLAEWLYSEEHKRFLYHLTKMQMPDGSWGPLPDGRTVIEWHIGNVAGDVAKGYQSDSKGCGLYGEEVAIFPKGKQLTPSHAPLAQDQMGVSGSGDMLAKFHAHMQDDNGKQENFVVTMA